MFGFADYTGSRAGPNNGNSKFQGGYPSIGGNGPTKS